MIACATNGEAAIFLGNGETHTMQADQQFPVSYLLFTNRGRIGRLAFLNAQIFIWLAFYILFSAIDGLAGYAWTIVLYPFLYWVLISTGTKRLHDTNISGRFLLALLIPVLGPLWLAYRLGLKKGKLPRNTYGIAPGITDDYLKNDHGQSVPESNTDARIINDVTGLNPIVVGKVVAPTTLDELQAIIASTDGPISVGGGRFSMGGQTASAQSTHLDMRSFNTVIAFSKQDKTITVQAGIRWCDIQRHIDEHDLSLTIMQTYANFTVGGSLSVNAHGRYVGQGPLILSVDAIDVVLADGSLVHATPEENADIFYGAIGGYNAIGVIAQVQLRLSDNVKVKRISKRLDRKDYWEHFLENAKNNDQAVFHNGDMFPPHYQRINAQTWVETSENPTIKHRLMPLRASYPQERYFFWAFSETPLGKWRRQYIYDPLLFMSKKIHWKNYEAGYDVAELEPKSREQTTYVLLEYFIPVDHFEEFSLAMAEIFNRHNVNAINVSIRHSKADPGSFLAWATQEVFAFVIYYKQGSSEAEKQHVAVWTREMIDAALSVEGSYYLPYQTHATPEQFHKAYPNAQKLIDLKHRLDPTFKFRNVIWDTYYNPESKTMADTESEFISVYSDTKWRDDFFRFLQVVFHLYPEDKFHALIKSASEQKSADEEIYKLILGKLPEIAPFLAPIRYGLPALKTQKQEMTRQTLELLGDQRAIDGYLEIGSTGRYISHLRKQVQVSGNIYLTNDRSPDNSLGEIFERGGIRKIGTFFDLADYQPISEQQIPTASIDLITCHIGLHHCPTEKLDAYMQSIHRILRPGGKFIMRDHDAGTPEMKTFASLVHTVFNLGLKETWKFNDDEFRSFRSIEQWCEFVCGHGFTDAGARLLQKNDPSINTLVLLTKGKA
jgi:FAD/FMN-containing dehydrogenase/uncharacterized membrane protein YhaH (DUF805 family)/SAM-dependent methyltransferase